MQVRFVDVWRYAMREKSTWVILFWQFCILPVLVLMLLRPLLGDFFFLLAGVTVCAGAISATTALTRLFGLNDSLSLVVGMVGMILMPVPLYIFLNFAVKLEVTLDVASYFSRILVFIFVPIALVWILRSVISESTDSRIRQQVPYAVLVLLMLFGLSVMDGVQELLLNEPLLLLQYVVFAFVLSLGLQLITYFVLRPLGHKDAMTACLLCAYRNMGVVAAIAGNALDDHFLIFVGVWQIPMYTLPRLLERIYRIPSLK